MFSKVATSDQVNEFHAKTHQPIWIVSTRFHTVGTDDRDFDHCGTDEYVFLCDEWNH